MGGGLCLAMTYFEGPNGWYPWNNKLVDELLGIKFGGLETIMEDSEIDDILRFACAHWLFGVFPHFIINNSSVPFV